MDDIQDLYTSFRDAERAWTRSVANMASTTVASSAVDPDSSTFGSIEECSLHYGEIAFLLAGLKPCVLIQFPTPELTHSFYHQVLEPQWMQRESFQRQQQQQQQGQQDDLGLSCRLITKDVRSPEMPLQGCVLVWSQKTVHSHPQSDLIQRAINLLFSSSHDPIQSQCVIAEKDMAIILDLPGRLPETEIEMYRIVEISYWDQGETPSPSDPQPVLLTTFAAQPDQIPSIHAHFKRYRDAVRDRFGVQLKFHMQSMANVA
ncbi:MAG: hypothetical protein J3Q66DRAFT_111416 [Benniella sp.]|nr:MAG: hypothetical protein J3Q66DRAFT_111416 [Benniella sp.]